MLDGYLGAEGLHLLSLRICCLRRLSLPGLDPAGTEPPVNDQPASDKQSMSGAPSHISHAVMVAVFDIHEYL